MGVLCEVKISKLKKIDLLRYSGTSPLKKEKAGLVWLSRTGIVDVALGRKVFQLRGSCWIGSILVPFIRDLVWQFQS